VIDTGIEAQFVQHVATFVGATGNADRPRAGHFGELSDQRADRSACRGNDDSLAGFGLA
jgi:hypothetical protein